MDRWLITFFIGTILSLFMPIVPDLFWISLLVLTGLLCLCIKKLLFISGLFFGSASILFSGFQYNDVWNQNNIDSSQFFKTKHSVIGKVTTIPTKVEFKGENSDKDPQLVEYNYKFNFEVTTVDHQQLTYPIIIRLNWNKTSQLIQQGDRFTLSVKLKPPHGLANQGAFNYQLWLRQNNIVASGYVIKSNKIKNNQQTSNSPSIRQSLYSKSLTLLPQHELSPLLTAFSFGERSRVSAKLWTTLNITNTQHLIAISGLHLGLIATGSFLLISFLFKVFPLQVFMTSRSRAVLFFTAVNIRYIAIFLSCSLTFYYAYLAGFSLPTIRALIMLLLFWFFRLMSIKCSLVTWLLLAIFIVLILNPMSLISGSFWLSFYAVSLILLTVWRFKKFTVGKNKLTTWLKSLVLVQLSLSVFMLPISILFNFQLSFVSIFANLIAVPLMSFTAIPLSLSAVMLIPFNHALSSGLYELALMSVEVLWQWLTYLSEQPWAIIGVSFKDIIVISLIISLLGLLNFLTLKKRYIFIVLFMSCFVMSYELFLNNNDKHWKVTVLDVGQGLSIVIERNNRAILYDTGASYPSGFNMVEASVLPYLKFKWINQLDKVIISHSDNDHAGGLHILKELTHVTQVMANANKLQGDRKCKQGDKFVWQELNFEILWPLNQHKHSGNENDDSCVIKVSDGLSSVLLTGDISKRVEKKLINDSHILPLLKSDVVIAPHHGSKTSSSIAFIQAISPDYVIYSAGFLNRWNMPSEVVQARYKNENVKAFNTASSGMIQIKISQKTAGNELKKINENTITIIPYREKTFPFWFSH